MATGPRWWSAGGVAVGVLAGVLSACGSATDIDVRLETRVAHVAPGAEPYDLFLDGALLVEALAPLQFLSALVAPAPHTYTFAGGGAELTAEAAAHDITGVFLMDATEPEAQAYGLDRAGVEEGQRVLVVHADSAEAPLTVLLEGPDTLAVTLEPGEGAVVSPRAETYGLRVRQGETGEAVSLPNVAVRPGDHFFLVIHPPGTEARFSRSTF